MVVRLYSVARERLSFPVAVPEGNSLGNLMKCVINYNGTCNCGFDTSCLIS